MYFHKGFMIDSARHMQEISDIKEIISAMAKLGFNKFHWHLTDDQGWRIESETFDKLNTVAAVRPYSDFGKTRNDCPYGRVYTKAEMREIVEFCKGLGIDVIPEFDMPGHTSALLHAYPFLSCGKGEVDIKTHQGIFNDILCPAEEKVYETVKKILDETLEIFPYEYIHIGGDETPSKQWEGCVKCRHKMQENGISDYYEYENLFLNEIIDYLENKGRHAIVWNDAARGKNLDKRAVIQYWKENDKASIDFINSGGKAILSPFTYYYMDYDYDITPLNRVYAFSPDLKGLSESAKENIIGLEAPIWTEYIENKEDMQKMLFPRVIAVAAALNGENNKSYKEFLQFVKEKQQELEKDGICFEDEKSWSKTRLSMPKGWLRFVKEHYSFEYIKSVLK